MVNVAEESIIRPNNEDTRVFQYRAECVEKISCPMQRNCCFASTRSTFYDNNATMLTPDDFVLFALDSSNDICHVVATRGVEGLQKSGFRGHSFSSVVRIRIASGGFSMGEKFIRQGSQILSK